MTFELAGILITAIATAVSAVLVYLARQDALKRSEPPIRAEVSHWADGLAVVYLRVFPTDRNVSIRRIYTNAQGIGEASFSQTEWGEIRYEAAHEHSSFLEVDLDLLPSNLWAKPVALALSIKLSSTQTCFQISLHSDRRRLMNQHKITTLTVRQPT